LVGRLSVDEVELGVTPRAIKRSATKASSSQAAQTREFLPAGLGQPPIGCSRRAAALQLADAQHIDQPALAHACQGRPNRVRRLSQLRSDLLVRKRTMLLKQREDRPLHHTER
jgi:hypothetical protein